MGRPGPRCFRCWVVVGLALAMVGCSDKNDGVGASTATTGNTVATSGNGGSSGSGSGAGGLGGSATGSGTGTTAGSSGATSAGTTTATTTSVGAGGSGQGGAGVGGANSGGAGGAPSDLHCEGEPDHCECTLDELNTWPPDTKVCAATDKIFCCKETSYPASGSCTCIGWSCTETSTECTCAPGSSSGTASCSSKFMRCCRDTGSSSSCMCHNFPQCLDSEVQVPSCAIADVKCGGDMAKVMNCR